VRGLFRILYIMRDVILCFISHVFATFIFVYLSAIQAIAFVKPELSWVDVLIVLCRAGTQANAER